MLFVSIVILSVKGLVMDPDLVTVRNVRMLEMVLTVLNHALQPNITKMGSVKPAIQCVLTDVLDL